MRHKKVSRTGVVRGTPEQKAQQVERRRKRYAELTPEQKAQRAESNRKWRADRTPEQKAQQSESNRKWRAEHPLTPEQKAQQAERKRKLYAELTPEQKAQRVEYQHKRYVESTPEQKAQQSERQRKWRAELTPEQKAQRLHEQRIKNCARNHGISTEEARRLYADSDARGMICPICQTKMHRGGKPDRTSEVVDHSHETGRIRGLICSGCNIVEGHIHKLPGGRATIKKLLDYMDAHDTLHKETV